MIEIPSLISLKGEKARRQLRYFFEHFAWPVLQPGTPFQPNWHIDAICDHLEAVARGEILKLIINMPFRMLKPVRIDTMVIERTRGRVEISSLNIGDEVLTHRGRFRKVLATQRQGELECLRITTRAGRQTVAALDHPFLTPRGWVEVSALVVGDTLAAVTAQQETTGDLSLEESRLLGYLIGDGSCNQGLLRFTNETPEILDDFEQCATAIGYHTYRREKAGNAAQTVAVKPLEERWRWQAHGPSPVVEWLARHMLQGATSYTKRVPAKVLTASTTAISAFIGAYWACDGTVAKSVRESFNVMAYTVSEGLARDLQHLLLRLGINAYVRRKITNVKTVRQGDTYETWAIFIPAEQHERFFACVPMAHPEKTRRLEAARGGTFDRVLHEDAVESIESVGKHECICIEVDEDHSFTADDLAVHNSTIVTQTFPAWVWIDQPSREFMTASYAKELATRDAVESRKIIDSDLYQAVYGDRFVLSTDQNVKSRYENDKRGKRITTSTESSGTGFGGDYRIVDDPVSAREADSAIKIKNSVEWWKGTFATRGNQPGKSPAIVVHQRMNTEDLTGYLLGHEKGWEQLILPFRFDPKIIIPMSSIGFKDPRTVPGQLIHPERVDEKGAGELEATLGSYHRNAQLQQNPDPRGGIIFLRAWWKNYRAEPKFDEIVISVDCTFKDSTTSDHVAIQAWGNVSAQSYLLPGRIKERMGFNDTVKAIRGMRAAVVEKYGDCHAVLIEDKANGSAVIETLKTEIEGVIAIEPEGGKAARAYATTPTAEAGNVFLPDPELEPNIEVFISTMSRFTGAEGGDDDEVDSATQYLNWRRQRNDTGGLAAFMKAQAQALEAAKAEPKLTDAAPFFHAVMAQR